MLVKKLTYPIIGLIALCSCDVDHAIRQVKVDADDGLSFFSSTAGNNITVTKKTGAGRMVCVRHGPDATYSETRAALGVFSGGGGGGGAGEAENEMTGRTPAIIGVRDLLYSLCLANLNGVISNKEYVRQYTELQKQAFELYATEAERTTISVNETTAPNQSASSGVGLNIDNIDPLSESSQSEKSDDSNTNGDEWSSNDSYSDFN